MSMELKCKLQQIIDEWENECVEFKEANDNFSTSEIGKYFSALANEANLHNRAAGWLVFGVRNRDRSVVGTTYRENHERLHSLKKQIADGADISFRQIHEVEVGGNRVVMFEIPPAPQGIPIAWQGHYFARAGESLAPLDLAKLDELRAQGPEPDWSAVICQNATMDDLHSQALSSARETFIQKFSHRFEENEIRSWSDRKFLETARLTIKGQIPRATLLLLGTPESMHHYSPYVAEMSWKLVGEETGYEHFHPPFFSTTTLLFQRIRNLKLTLLPPAHLIPIEVNKYERAIVLEALHNCIAHQDYTRCERILVIEKTDGLTFQNAGWFYDGAPTDYVLEERVPTRYRNRFLAQAMVTLRMIDSMGYGIREVMYRGQARRYFPLPEYDLSKPNHVVMALPGRFMDENYSHALLAGSNLSWQEIFALDRIQKGLKANEDMARSLRTRGILEGRKPNWRISSNLAVEPEEKTEYIKHRAFDDDYYCDLIVDFLREFGEAKRTDMDRLLWEKLSSALDEKQKRNKIKNLLQRLRRKGLVKSAGPKKTATWTLTT